MYVLPPEIIHTMNHTTSPNLSSSPEQGTSSFEKHPTFEKMKILTTLQQKKPKLLLCTEDSKLYVLYIYPHPKSLYTIYKCKIQRIKEKEYSELIMLLNFEWCFVDEVLSLRSMMYISLNYTKQLRLKDDLCL